MIPKEEIDEKHLELLPLPEGTFHSIAVSPNGRYLYISMRSTNIGSVLILWDIQKEKIVKITKAISQPSYMYFSPDSKYIGVGYPGALIIYDLNGSKIRTISPDFTIAHFAWRPNGKHIAIATLAPCLLVTRAFKEGRMRHWGYPYSDECPNKVFGVAWHPDGKRLAVLHEEGLTIHEMPYLKIVRSDECEYSGSGNPPLLYSPDGKYIAVELSSVLIFDGEELELLPEERFPFSGGGNITFYDWSVQRYIVISTTANEVYVWNFESAEIEKVWAFKFRKDTFPRQVVMHPDGKTIFVRFYWQGIGVLRL